MAYAELSIDEDEKKGPGFDQLFNDAATTVYEFSEGQLGLIYFMIVFDYYIYLCFDMY